MIRAAFFLPLVLWTNIALSLPLGPGEICELLLRETPITEEEAIEDANHALSELNPNLKFDSYNMVIPDQSAETHQKIVKDVVDLKARIESAAQSGKHILILNGGFDLIHKGHAIFVSYSVAEYMKTNGLTRDQLFVVVSADSDNLLGIYKSSKWVGNGGKENFQRPVQRQEEFSEAAYNTRALDLASIEAVDAAFMTPSPFELNDALIKEISFKSSIRTALEALEARAQALLSRKSELGLSLREQNQYISDLEPFMRAMGRLLLMENLALIQEEFLVSSRGEKSSIWNLTSWNFLLQSYLFDSLTDSDRVSRVLNKSDGDYLAVVAVMENLAGANVVLMPENRVMSTTGILSNADYKELILAKRKSHGLKN